MMKCLLTAAMTATLMAVLAGCAVLEDIERNPMTSQLVTSQLTLRFIASDDDPVERAAAVRAAVDRLEARLDEGREFTLEQFQKLAFAEFDFDSLSPADQDLVVYGLNLARQSIAELIGEGVVQPDERYTLKTVLEWIDQAAARVR